MTQSQSHHQLLAAFVAEHHEQLEAYEDSEKETAWLAEVLLKWARANEALNEVQTE